MGHVREWTGVALIAVGAIGCVLSLMPGIPIIAAGAMLLGARHPVVKRGRVFVKKVRRRFR